LKAWSRLAALRVSAISGLLASFLTFAIGIILAHLVDIGRHALGMQIAGWNGWSVVVVGAGLVLNWIVLLYVMKRIEDLQATNRLNLQYFGDVQLLGRTDLLSFVHKMEPGAEFFILNRFNYPFYGFEREAQAVREMYFEALARKLPTIHYHRIIQIDPQASLRDFLDETYLSHFRAVTKLRDQGESGRLIQLVRVPLRYPYIFFIIKNPSGSKYFSLDVFEELQAPGRYKVIGSLHVTDPDEQLIAPFEALFRNLASSSGLKVIQVADLGPSQSET
jgi:hypothetical protein